MGSWASRVGVLWPLLFLADLVGAAYGFVWYRPALTARPFVLWPLVADCPTAALLLASAVGMRAQGRSVPALFAAAEAWGLFYGMWTLVVLTLERSGDYLLYASHVALLAEASLLGRLWTTTARTRFAALGLLTVAVILDDTFGLRPPLPPTLVPAAEVVSAVLLVLLTVGWAWRPAPRAATGP